MSDARETLRDFMDRRIDRRTLLQAAASGLTGFAASAATIKTALAQDATPRGVIYGVVQNNDLLWYRHDGRNDGTFRWAFDAGKKVGNGWDVKHVFSGGDGIIYAVMQNSDLLWFRHDGRADGTFRWAYDAGKKVGNGWDVKHVFYGGDSLIYAVTQNNDLLWYRHDGRNDGTFRWAFDAGKKVGEGWDMKQVFAG